jgi:hypothetical protein
MEGGGEKGKGKMGNSNRSGTVYEPVGIHIGLGYCSGDLGTVYDG